MMKIAQLKTPKKNTPQNVNHPHTVKMTYAAKAEGLVQNFAARWCSIRKHPIQYKTSNQEQQCKTQLKKRKKTQHAYNHKEKNSNQQSQNYYYSHFYFKTKQKRPSGAVRTAKRTKEALRQIF